jgi:hypothetical protein
MIGIFDLSNEYNVLCESGTNGSRQAEEFVKYVKAAGFTGQKF